MPCVAAGSIAVIGNLKQMNPYRIKGTSITGYGVNLTVGIGIPIPILSEEILYYTMVKDEEIRAPIVDYSQDYPLGKEESIGEVNYAQLKRGKIRLQGKDIPTAGLSSYAKAKEIAEILKKWIKQGEFLLTEPVKQLPSVDSGIKLKNLKERPLN